MARRSQRHADRLTASAGKLACQLRAGAKLADNEETVGRNVDDLNIDEIVAGQDNEPVRTRANALVLLKREWHLRVAGFVGALADEARKGRPPRNSFDRSLTSRNRLWFLAARRRRSSRSDRSVMRRFPSLVAEMLTTGEETLHRPTDAD